MDGKYITGICTVFVAVLMVGGLLMPIIDHTTEGEVKTNDGAGWIRMNYDTAASAYTINISASDDGITVANGTDTQTGDDETIYYADSNLAVWLEDGYFTVLGQSTNGPVFFQSEDDITITRDSEGVSVTDGMNTVSVGAPAWAYVPYSSGSYGFFADGTPVSIETPMAAVGGGFAGVYAYNDITRYAGLGLELQTVTEDGKITGAYWAKPSAEESSGEFNPGSITPINPGAITGGDADIQPIDPIVIDDDPDASIMSVPTPTYTDGDWGYDLTTVDGVQKVIIVSYSGTGGDIVIPATVGGYDVVTIGKGGSYQGIFSSSITTGSTVTITNGPTKINNYAFNGPGGRITGTITIPDSVTVIGDYAFGGLSNVTGLVLPSNLTSIGSDAFRQMSSVQGVIEIPDSVTTIGNSAFYNCSQITGIKLPNNLTTIPINFMLGCSHFVGPLVIPTSVTAIKGDAFSSCYYLEGTVVISENVTTLGAGAFNSCSKVETLIIASDATPGTNTFGMSGVTEVLDLSSTVDYSVDRYGIAAAAAVQDNIGDSIGYISYVSISSGSDVPASASALMYVIPAIILVSLIIFSAVVFVRRE